ncbi:MAG: methyltransferase domain-containing protein [Bdellovibrionales bacterium]
MSKSIAALVEKVLPPRVLREARGILADFWKDTPCTFPAIELKLGPKKLSLPNILKPVPRVEAIMPAAALPAAPSACWHAQPGELAEKMWGEGCMLPAADAIMEMLAAPLQLNKEKSLIDFSAGLGGAMRKIAGRVDRIQGYDIDPAIAARGMEMSAKAGKAKQAPIESFDPQNLSLPAMHDGALARELFYRVSDKGKLFYIISSALKPGGAVSFTDYIVDPENRDQPAIVAWQAYESMAQPSGVIEMAEAWAKVGFVMHASEDQTPLYRQEVVKGINSYVAALKAAPPPDPETKKAILYEVELWIHRLAAIQQGMKFYRFFAAKS